MGQTRNGEATVAFSGLPMQVGGRSKKRKKNKGSICAVELIWSYPWNMKCNVMIRAPCCSKGW